MPLTRRGFLKSFVAAASLAVARHYAPAAVVTPAMQPRPLAVGTILGRMAEALDRIEGAKPFAPVFYMSPATYRRIVEVVRGSGPVPGQNVLGLAIGDHFATVEPVDTEVDESGALIAIGADGTRRIIDVETGEEMQATELMKPVLRLPTRR